MLTIDHAVERLRERVRGTVVTPGDAQWDDARRAWNLALDQRPELVVQAAHAHDVVEAVRLAREHGLRVAMQGTGHGGHGLELEGAILVKTERMRGVEIDPRGARRPRGGRRPVAGRDGAGGRARPRRAGRLGRRRRRGRATPSAAASAGSRAATAWPPTAWWRPRSSSPTAGSCASTPGTSPTCSGPCAAAAAASPRSPRWSSSCTPWRRSTRACSCTRGSARPRCCGPGPSSRPPRRTS